MSSEDGRGRGQRGCERGLGNKSDRAGLQMSDLSRALSNGRWFLFALFGHRGWFVLTSTPVDAVHAAIRMYPATDATAATGAADPGTRKLKTASYHSGRVDTRERQVTGSCRPLLMGGKLQTSPKEWGGVGGGERRRRV